ncbi:flippase [Methanosarcina mazei]|uniref:Uncharacterized protein n=1 Tax=Methanosarcina mazei TaxID=2209 RepID=A0A0F8JN74_METMZ|nr:flippase [Methanosarcina mazei]KKG02319.1 hypothetical protein DU40_14700 [Methanosarcina mazei]KKG51276.1 hypothetical protein DU33_03785 [Methanosarcina mazei]KKG59651.1 hypothetical protein DU64_07835 [Methanosarcina mazei]KKG63757.1 hypothetical protein DU45_09125 [Methanosarcina mazei]KKG81093.1 hypothetical protein DU55_09935 [Methanosarcina mazei]
MNTINKIFQNTGFLLAGKAGTKLISLLTVIYIVRYLGDAGYGKYTFAFAFVSFFTLISEMGTHHILVREISRSQKNANLLLGNTILISIVLSFLALLLAIFSINFMNYPLETEKLVLVAALGLLFGSLSNYGIMYEVNLNMKYPVILGLLSRIFLLISVSLVVIYDLGIFWIVILTVVSDALPNILMMIISRNIFLPNFKYDAKLCKYILKESLPLAMAAVFIAIYYRIDVVMLSWLKGDVDVGIYSAAYRLTEAFTFIPVTFMVSIFPLMSRYYTESTDKLMLSYLKSFKFLFIIALPLAIGISLISDKIILTVYGNQFENSIQLLQILIWSTAIVFINYPLTQLLISTNNQKIFSTSTAICAALNVVLNFILIPNYSYIGASVATVITQLVNGFIILYYKPKELLLSQLFNEVRVPLFAAVSMAIFTFYSKYYLNLTFTIALSVILYFILLYAFGGLDYEEKKILLNLKLSFQKNVSRKFLKLEKRV